MGEPLIDLWGPSTSLEREGESMASKGEWGEEDRRGVSVTAQSLIQLS